MIGKMISLNKNHGKPTYVDVRGDMCIRIQRQNKSRSVNRSLNFVHQADSLAMIFLIFDKGELH